MRVDSSATCLGSVSLPKCSLHELLGAGQVLATATAVVYGIERSRRVGIAQLNGRCRLDHVGQAVCSAILATGVVKRRARGRYDRTV